MAKKASTSRFQAAVAARKGVLIAEIRPRASGDPASVTAPGRELAAKVQAVGVCDNQHCVGMSALAAAALLAAERVEPILHVTTRDRNRIALASEALGAAALGIGNLLCTSGEHQTLGTCRSARNVHDLDSTQLIQMYSHLGRDGSLLGQIPPESAPVFCIGGVASPFADPPEMQISRLAKKVQAGARFLITQSVFDLERMGLWWQEVAKRKIEQKVAIVAGVRVLVSGEEAAAVAGERPSPMLPPALLKRLQDSSAGRQRQTGVAIACEMVEKLRALPGLAGFSFCGDDPAAILAVIEASGLKAG